MGGCSVSGDTAPLTQTIFTSTVSGTGRATMTRRMRLRSSSFLCSGRSRPLAQSRVGPLGGEALVEQVQLGRRERLEERRPARGLDRGGRDVQAGRPAVR